MAPPRYIRCPPGTPWRPLGIPGAAQVHTLKSNQNQLWHPQGIGAPKVRYRFKAQNHEYLRLASSGCNMGVMSPVTVMNFAGNVQIWTYDIFL